MSRGEERREETIMFECRLSGVMTVGRSLKRTSQSSDPASDCM